VPQFAGNTHIETAAVGIVRVGMGDSARQCEAGPSLDRQEPIEFVDQTPRWVYDQARF